jgi:hypothetical protein
MPAIFFSRSWRWIGYTVEKEAGVEVMSQRGVEDPFSTRATRDTRFDLVSVPGPTLKSRRVGFLISVRRGLRHGLNNPQGVRVSVSRNVPCLSKHFLYVLNLPRKKKRRREKAWCFDLALSRL